METNHILLIVFLIGTVLNGLAMFEAFRLKRKFNITYSRRLRRAIKKDIDTVVLAKRITYIFWLQNAGVFVMLLFFGLFFWL
ncbi:hypothetical protein L3049_20380 [Labilibaculum sp. DW002]|uniref:Uncharacterized protein n=1 Tax=Paralabilibaculum antarcticum TaxID=2912572 RepID=A0ABT5W0J7_9BACT|nr:hypothetical protein [Labilibaculum sp. DW002]MDE5420358.1 hypothetical protein [Labilibaculum sp. DW002]